MRETVGAASLGPIQSGKTEAGTRVTALDVVKLTSLMELTSGRPDLLVGLLDGPVALSHPDLAHDRIRELPTRVDGSCAQASGAACVHGTFVAGMLCGKRGSTAPAICPNCTLLVRPIFGEPVAGGAELPSASPQELAVAMIECIEAGARVLNVSAALAYPSTRGERAIEEALDYALRRGVIVVAAAGNQGTLGSTAITRHPWVIPVAACDLQGRPLGLSNLGSSIGRRGLRAPGDRVTSLGATGAPLTSSGTSVAAPFVTGTVALLWSRCLTATAAEVRFAVTQCQNVRQTTVVPPLLDAWAAYRVLAAAQAKGERS
jgi:subtilisin family serine protease